MERIKIRTRIHEFDESWITGNIDEVISCLQEKKKYLSEIGYENITIEKEYDYGYEGIYMLGFRFENDIEFNQRKIAEEKKLQMKAKKLEKEKKEYERLKAKFEER